MALRSRVLRRVVRAAERAGRGFPACRAPQRRATPASVLILDRTIALELMIARAADRGVPEHFALRAAAARAIPEPRPERAIEETAGAGGVRLPDGGTRRPPALVASPQPWRSPWAPASGNRWQSFADEQPSRS